ncbi:hypothetical protein B9Q10_00875, partial [Candidatus Marsarchaeota G2 archaeon ECH_B_SAG-E12]
RNEAYSFKGHLSAIKLIRLVTLSSLSIIKLGSVLGIYKSVSYPAWRKLLESSPSSFTNPKERCA